MLGAGGAGALAVRVPVVPRGVVELEEADVLHQRARGSGAGGEPARPAVAPGLLEHDLLEEGAGGGGHELRVAAALAGLVQAPGHGAGVGRLLGEELAESRDGIVAEIAPEAAGARFAPTRAGPQGEVVVGVEPRPGGTLAPDKAEARLGLPGVVERPATVVDLAVEHEAVERGLHLQRLLDGRPQLGSQRFVAVER